MPIRLAIPTGDPQETIVGVGKQIREGRLRSVELVSRCLERIDQLEPQIRAWVIIDRAGAMDQAGQRDAEIAAGAYRGPLHGVPIGIKDIIDIAGLPTAAGSDLFEQNIAASDAEIVARLRRAGAVILGKTVTTQFASFDPPATRNPWNLERTPGGSSSGSAAAVACGMCLAAIGSQTGGSITRPAAYCGVAGCKPAYGRVPTAGIMPLSPSMDHPGPIARSVRDLAILLEAIADAKPQGDERWRSWTRAEMNQLPAAVLMETKSGALTREIEAPLPRPPRVGLLRGLFWDRAEPPMRAMIENTMLRLNEAGADVHEVALPENFADVLESHRTIMAVEAAAEHGTLFESNRNQFLPKIRGLIEEGLATSATAYVRARRHQQQLSNDMAACFVGHDVLLTPATVGPVPDRSTTGDPAFNSPWSFTGLPTVSFPVEIYEEVSPLAIQLIGYALSEGELLRVAAWCEDRLSLL